MNELNLTKDSQFIVKDSIGISLFVALVFSAITFSAVVYDSNTGSYVFPKAILFGLVPAVIFTVKIFIRKPAIVVDKAGIFAGGKLITDRNHFANAFFTEQPKAGRFTDNFVLIVEYSEDEIPDTLNRRFRLRTRKINLKKRL